MAAIAVHDTLSETCGLAIDIKWPNDILTKQKKLCGILAETIETKDGRAVVLGIGINLTTTAFPSDIADRAISIEEASSKPPDRELILLRLVKNIGRYYKLLNTTNGNAQILDAWSSRSSYAYGRLIRVSASEEIIQGVTRGLEADGALRVETDEGEIKVVHAGDVLAVRPSER
jgi:BirA family biotin operon repressor/biotin-[acetyl-CoA-carboxylase] ligase